jgi:hypothetical protein
VKIIKFNLVLSLMAENLVHGENEKSETLMERIERLEVDNRNLKTSKA